MIRNIQPHSISYGANKNTLLQELPQKQILPVPENITKTEKEITGVNWTTGISVAVTTVILGILLFSRGAQKNFSKYLNKFKEFLENKIELSSLNESDKKRKFYEFSVRRVNSFLRKSESINNITSLKDILFMKFMYKTNPTKKLHNAISNSFEYLSEKTVTNSYKKTERIFSKMNLIFDELDKKILEDSPDEIIEYEGKKYTKKQLVALAKDRREDALLAINTFMTKEARQDRYKYMNEVTSSLYSKFWDVSFKDFWTKDNKFKRKEMWQTFIAAEQIKGNKTELIKNINYTKEMMSYSDAYRENLIVENIKELSTIIPADDIVGQEIAQKLEYLVKNSQDLIKDKERLLKELEKLENHKTPLEIDEQVSNVQEDYKKTCIDIIRNQIKDSDKGYFQQMLSIYNEVAPYELSKTGASRALMRAVNSFDESVRLEIMEFFDKIRDLRLGSAPTDVLTVLISFIMISFGLGHAKDKDERNSIILKSGIPIAGAIATSMISATKLVSGGKSLALGFVSGIILNKIGKFTDDGLKYYKQKSEKNKKK